MGTALPPAMLHAEMVAKVRKAGRARQGEVERALLDTPRHEFVPDVDLAVAYDPWQAVVTHRFEDGRSLSCASAPWLVAAMLDQLDVQPGNRVLEIGAGTGYNACLLARLTGRTEQKANTVAVSGGQLLADDPVLGAERGTVERFLKEAYSQRNAEIRGGHASMKAMTLLSGDKTTDLARVVEDLTRLMGRAIQSVLAELTRPQPRRPAQPLDLTPTSDPCARDCRTKRQADMSS